MRIAPALALGGILLVPSLGSGQVYRWEDQDALHFTNTYDRVPEPHRNQVGPRLQVAPEPTVPAAVQTTPTSGVTRIPYLRAPRSSSRLTSGARGP